MASTSKPELASTAGKDDEEPKTEKKDVVESEPSAEDVPTDKSIPPEVLSVSVSLLRFLQ